MELPYRSPIWRVFPALLLGVNLIGWIWLYSLFLRSFFLVPNPYQIPLSLLQWLPGLTAALLASNHLRARLTPAGRAWFCLLLALVLWPFGDVVELLLAPSLTFLHPLAWLVHLAAFGCALTAVFFFAPVPEVRFGRLRFLLDLTIHAASWGLLLWFLLVSPILRPSFAGDSATFWPAVYAILDVTLLMLILWLQGQARRPAGALWFLAGAFFLFSVHQIVSGWITLLGGTQGYIWTGFLMLGGYALVIVAAAMPDQQLESGSRASIDKAGISSWQRWRRLWQQIEARWLPLLSTMALAAFLLEEWRRRGTPDPILIGCTIGLGLLLFLREGVVAGQDELAGYAVLLENLEDPAFICSAEGTVLLSNPSMRLLSKEPLTEKKLANLVPVTPDWTFLLKSAASDGWRGEVWIESPVRGGYPAWLVLQSLPQDETGGRSRYAALLHDLSPQRRQEESLREAYRQAEESRSALEQLSGRLEEKVRDKTADLSSALIRLEEQNRQLLSLDRMKSEFVAFTSHELRTPLSGIRAGLELILSKHTGLPGPVEANLHLVQKESDRLARFVESILDLTALEAGRMPVQSVPIPLKISLDQARTALATVHGGLDSQNLRRLDIRLPVNLPDVLADEHLLASVFFQLIDNSFKYAPAGPITVRASSEDGRVEVTVSDRGPGVTQEQSERLFRMFSRLEDTDSPRVRGVGLGLYISRKMVEAMGGTLDLVPSDRGMSLRIRIPLPAGES